MSFQPQWWVKMTFGSPPFYQQKYLILRCQEAVCRIRNNTHNLANDVSVHMQSCTYLMCLASHLRRIWKAWMSKIDRINEHVARILEFLCFKTDQRLENNPHYPLFYESYINSANSSMWRRDTNWTIWPSIAMTLLPKMVAWYCKRSS